jgi:hypothetical protein
MATFTTDGTGRLIATAGPPLHIPPTQHITGSFIDAATAKTLAAQQVVSEAAKSLGIGQRGSGRHSRKWRGGAVNLNAQIPFLPEAGTIRGVSHETNHLTSVNNLNQIRADGIYDQHINAAPYQVAGRKLRKTKRKSNGSRHHRTHRRKRSKSSSHRGRKRSSRK